VMAGYAIEPPARASVEVAGSAERFPVRRVYCIGRNYAAHAREMGRDPDREPPFFFLKPADCVVTGTTVPYPPLTEELHFEVELVVAIGRGGADIAAADAIAHVWGAGAGIDLTRRDLQGVAKDLSRPWDEGKAFDGAAPCGPLRPLAEIPTLAEGRISLALNGAIRQDGNLSEMIWGVPDLIARISRSMRLAPGDLIMTGTPAGVGPCRPGDRLRGEIEGIGAVDVRIGERL